MKYTVSIGNGHCEIEQFLADTLMDIKTHFRKEYPTREEQAQLYVNVRTTGEDFNNFNALLEWAGY